MTPLVPFSTGDRSTERRDTKQPDSLDYMGHHTESIDPRSLPKETLGEIFPIPEEGFGGLFSDIGGGGNLTGRNQAMGYSAGSDGRADSARGYSQGGASAAGASPAVTPATNQQGGRGGGATSGGIYGGGAPSRDLPGASMSPWEVQGGGGAAASSGGSPAAGGGAGGIGGVEIGQLLSQVELDRREAALRAATSAQAAAAWRAAWNVKASLVA